MFGCGYDDVELLGRAVGRDSGWYSRGLLLHVQNGAVFGAVYANIAPALPVPPRSTRAGRRRRPSTWRCGR